MNISRWLSIAIIVAVGMATCFADETAPTELKNQNRLNDTDVLAEWNGGVITRKDLDTKISHLPVNQQGRYRTVDGQIQVLDIMAMEEAFMAKAIQLGVDKDPDVMKLIEAGTRQFYIQEYYKRNVSDLVIVTQADKQRYYDDNKQAFYEFPNITLNYIQTKDEADALAAIAELQAGKSFGEVSDAYNINTYAKGIKGVIKNIRLNGNIPGVGNDLELEKHIADSQPDPTAINGPFKTNSGWHLFQTVDYKAGRQKPFDEVMPELEQRARPGVETRILNDLTDRLKAKYAVAVDTTRVDEIDLKDRAKNEEIMDLNLISSSNPDLNITVAVLLDRYAQLSPQEQLFFSKGEAARQLLDQELVRSLLYADAKAQDYSQNLKENPEFEQMKRYYILNRAFRQLVVDAIQITSEEARAYYDEHIDDYSTPPHRKIEVLWFTDADEAEAARSKYDLYVGFNDQTRIDKLIADKSVKPQLRVLQNIYDNGIITGVGPDKDFCDMVWDNPVGYISPVFTAASGDILFFRTLEETPTTAQSFTELEPRIYGMLKNQRQSTQQETVTQQLYEEFQMVKYPEKIRLELKAEDLFSMADNSARQRNFKDAISFYNQIITNFPNGADDYRASFMKAFLIAEELKDEAQALQLFKDFLKKYPSGELNESAQFMIDSLEGNAVLEIEE
ncbi:MAG TPA: peptidyl-prolyl cis-trans isomerase [Candidatus Syntrophosphaera sp.]|mgnify:FL=1|nr:peptidyl-prolyl cis-trans isomerase [Candidatus Syntrophosphaera sp.]